MKHTFRTYVIALAMAALLLSACSGAPAAAPAEQASVKVDASLIAYTGTIDSISGEQWVVNGQPLTVDPSIVRDGPFQAGDTIKVEGSVNADGSFTVTRVEMPSASDMSDLPQIGDPQTDGNTNDTNTNDTNTNDTNTNDTNTNDANTNDDNMNDDNSNSDDANSNDDGSNSNDDDDDGNSNSDDDDDDNSNSSDSGNSNDDDDDHDDNDNDDDDDHDDNSNGS
jgi:hypothetical protein